VNEFDGGVRFGFLKLQFEVFCFWSQKYT